MKRIVAGLAMTCLLLQGCSGKADDAGLTGQWIEWYNPYGSIYDLNLAPDHTFTATAGPLAHSCRFPEDISDTRAQGRWTFDGDTHRISLDYDAPALAKCKLSAVRSIVVDPSGGQTDLLIYPSGVEHLSDRVRLIRPRPPPRSPAWSRPQTQVECFRARGKWEKWCHPNEYQCLMPYRDAGKACTDSSQCEGLCLVDMVVVCERGKECVEPPIPEPGQPFVGICQRDDAGCGSFIEIHKGRAEPAYHID